MEEKINENRIAQENIFEENLINNPKVLSNDDEKLSIKIRNKGNYICIFFVLFYLVFAIIGIISSLLDKNDVLSLALTLFFICVFIIIMIIQLNTKRIELIKDTSNNLLIIKKYNLLNYKKETINLCLENFIFDILTDKTNEDNIKYHLLIVDTFKNLCEIDLDSSNILKKPIKIFYLIKNIKYEENINKEALNRFIGAPPDVKNPIIELKTGTSIADIDEEFKLKKYIKISENFFSYYFKEPFLEDSTFILFLFCVNFICIILLLLYIFEVDKKNELMAGFVICILIVFNLIFIFRRVERIKRMDVVYTKDFKKMFIGLVKYYEKTYKKFFVLDINNIEKFKFEHDQSSNKYFNINVELKNEEVKKICKMENEEDSMNVLLIALNEKIVKNDEIFINSINS